jgi:outer membrane protein
VKKIILLAVMVMLVASFSAGQSLKIAYVNSEKILLELPEAQQVKKELETSVKGWQDELEKMGKELQDGIDDFQKKEALLAPEAKAAKQKSLQDLQQRAREFQYQKFDQREGEVVQMRAKKFAPIQDRVMKAIEQIAKEDGFNYVFDKLEAATNLLYADVKFDLTYKVIDFLKRGTPVAPTPAKSKDKDAK